MQIQDYDVYEPVRPDRAQYRNMQNGNIISRRQYDNLVNSGAIPRHPDGAFYYTKRNKTFVNSNTIHTVISIEPRDLTSLWRVSTVNTSPNLPSNVSIAYRAIARLEVVSSRTGKIIAMDKVGLQTSFWNTRAGAWQEWQDLLDSVRKGEVYGQFSTFNITSFEVVLRAG